MFNDIAPRYDFLNHVLSLGIDKLWRKRLIKGIVKHNPESVLDMATGTADLAIALAKKSANTSVVGIDISENMLSVGVEKVTKLKLNNRISFTKASAESIPFADNSFDAAMVAFGVRNFENPLNGLKEMLRVIKPGGSINVLEFTTPRLWIVRFFYQFYFKRILPWVGRTISGHKTAYTYLPNSVAVFQERQNFVNLLVEAGFVEANFKLQSFGIAAIYRATKPIDNNVA